MSMAVDERQTNPRTGQDERGFDHRSKRRIFMKQLRVEMLSLLMVLLCSLSGQAQQGATAANATVPPLIQFSNVATDEGSNTLSGVANITLLAAEEREGDVRHPAQRVAAFIGGDIRELNQWRHRSIRSRRALLGLARQTAQQHH